MHHMLSMGKIQSGEISGTGKPCKPLISGTPNVFRVIKQTHLLPKLLQMVISILLCYIQWSDLKKKRSHLTFADHLSKCPKLMLLCLMT